MLDLRHFKNPVKNVYVLKKWNWDYLEAERFQLECVDFVTLNPHISILLICSHPHCFTLGRGLQKIKETTKINLIDFDPASKLDFPLYQIKRGGGLTFHYPEQIVIYPILSLTKHQVGVYDLMLEMLFLTKDILEKQFNFRSLVINRDLLGLWFENSFAKVKMASIGLAASRYVTYHGLALNFAYDEKMFSALKALHPCGLPGDVYRNVETLADTQLSELDRDKWIKTFEVKFLNYLNQLSINKDLHL